METVKIPFTQAGVMIELPVQIEQGQVVVDGLLKLLKIQPRYAKLAARVTPVEFDAWLKLQVAAKTRQPAILKHLQDHFLAIVSASLPVVAFEATQVVKPKDDLLDVAYPLDGVDFFRKDAAHGSHRLRPEQIDYSANNGWVDLFVKPPPSMWGDDVSEYEHRRVEITPGTFREDVLTDMRRANEEVYTGPEMVERGLPMPRGFERSLRESHKAVLAKSEVANTGRTIVVPEHPRIYTWEHAVMIGKKNAEDVELPGSPYNGKLPLWHGL